MPVVIALLRGVNVGGHNMIKMDALRTLCGALQFHDVETYVQSGNVVFRTAQRSLPRLAAQIEDRIEQEFGFRPSVILRTADELQRIVEMDPFADRDGLDPRKRGVLFLATDPGNEAKERVLALKAHPDEVRIADRELYLYLPNGFGRATLVMAAVERALRMRGTARNWNTVTTLLEMSRKRNTSR